MTLGGSKHSAALAAAHVLASVSRPLLVVDEPMSPDWSTTQRPETYTDRMMESWVKEDQERNQGEYTLRLAPNGWAPVRITTEAASNPPMKSGKNLSPKRLAIRRDKNKAARKARRHNRKKK
jgi:hypothetical protein